ncbi:MAG: GNAT family N-acetyltransferase [Chloroflexi bacterium]|nr:GNAT family N-acetyltransferase [Chloroflexota bacterium]
MSARVSVRIATEADAALLAEVERRSPLVFGERQLVIDRGTDYFAAARLMEDVTVLLAEVDGEPAAVYCAARHGAAIGGRPITATYIHHARVRPEFQRMGVGRACGDAMTETLKARPSDTTYFYIGPENATSQAFAKAATNRWSFGPVRLRFDCAALAGAPAGRPSTPADAHTVAAILNATHAGEEMFLPYTAESLRARLERAPAQYGWDRLWIDDGAVLGLWPEGESLSTRARVGAGPWHELRDGAVLDYGYIAGAEPRFLALLRAWCGWSAKRGMTELGLFASESRPAHALLAPLAAGASAMDFWTPGIAEPAGAKGRGLYTDAVYF